MNARVRESLRVALSHLAPVVRAKLAAIFVAGSAADPNAKLGLDVDLWFLIDADCQQRQHLLLDASRVIDIFVGTSGTRVGCIEFSRKPAHLAYRC